MLGLLKLDRSRLSPRTPRWWQRAEGARSRGKAHHERRPRRGGDATLDGATRLLPWARCAETGNLDGGTTSLLIVADATEADAARSKGEADKVREPAPRREERVEGGRPQRRPPLCSSGDLSPLPAQQSRGEPIDRLPLVVQWNVLRAAASTLPVEVQAGTAHPIKLAIAPAIGTVRISTGTPGTLRHRPVMVLTSREPS